MHLYALRAHASILLACAAVLLLACGHAAPAVRGEEGGGTTADHVEVVSVDLPKSNPPERDDPKAPLLHFRLLGAKAQPIVVPYFYGYPLYAEGAAIQGVRMLRQENWDGYAREEQTDADGVIHVIEKFPALGCRFEGVQEDETTYVPLFMECGVPAPKARGSQRPVVAGLGPKGKADQIPKGDGLAKVFLGEWHATTEAADGTMDAGYFDTPFGLVGFRFKKSKLTAVAFVFDAPERRWRKPDLWRPPLGYTVGQ